MGIILLLGFIILLAAIVGGIGFLIGGVIILRLPFKIKKNELKVIGTVENIMLQTTEIGQNIYIYLFSFFVYGQLYQATLNLKKMKYQIGNQVELLCNLNNVREIKLCKNKKLFTILGIVFIIVSVLLLILGGRIIFSYYELFNMDM